MKSRLLYFVNSDNLHSTEGFELINHRFNSVRMGHKWTKTKTPIDSSSSMSTRSWTRIVGIPFNSREDFTRKLCRQESFSSPDGPDTTTRDVVSLDRQEREFESRFYYERVFPETQVPSPVVRSKMVLRNVLKIFVFRVFSNETFIL